MNRTPLSRRRRLVLKLLGGGGLLALSGCDSLSRSQWFPALLRTAEPVNRTLHHLISGRNSMAKEFSESAVSIPFRANGTRRPVDADYLALLSGGFTAWRLQVGGLVERPLALSLDELRALPSRTQVTRHDCVEGWSAIAKWKGARLSALIDAVRPRPEARYVVFHCFDTMDRGGAKYYESIDFEDAYHPQTILAYEWNDRPLPVAYGAPLRVRVERQLGYKMAKYIRSVELVDSFANIAGGRGGYWEDRGYAWYAGI